MHRTLENGGSHCRKRGHLKQSWAIRRTYKVANRKHRISLPFSHYGIWDNLKSMVNIKSQEMLGKIQQTFILDSELSLQEMKGNSEASKVKNTLKSRVEAGVDIMAALKGFSNLGWLSGFSISGYAGVNRERHTKPGSMEEDATGERWTWKKVNSFILTWSWMEGKKSPLENL